MSLQTPIENWWGHKRKLYLITNETNEVNEANNLPSMTFSAIIKVTKIILLCLLGLIFLVTLSGLSYHSGFEDSKVCNFGSDQKKNATYVIEQA